MLILTRRIGETLMIGDSVVVTVCGIRGRRVNIGITAPISIGVHRKENLRMPSEASGEDTATGNERTGTARTSDKSRGGPRSVRPRRVR